ncbi:ABC transporter ATP-binding protein [Nonomuraea sp. NPDC048826]|uniref:ABC transporter ATP-binding protein n=1 Tax=Nonomuraea sp. NPDC048826 TaxID=3364347 RepID=UPI00371B25B9
MTDRAVPAVIRVLPRVSAGLTVTLLAVLLLQALLSVAFILSTGAVVSALAERADTVGVHLSVLMAVFVARLAIVPVANAVANGLARRVTAMINQTTLEGALRPVGIGHLIDPAVADRILLAQGVTTGHPPGAAVTSLAGLLSSRLSGLAAAITLATVEWWLPLPLAAVWMLLSRWRLRDVRRAVSAVAETAPALRHAGYARNLAIGDAAAKEIRVFGLQDWLLGRFTRDWHVGMAALHSSSGVLVKVTSLLLLAAAHTSVFLYLAFAVAGGRLGVASLVIALQAITGMAMLGYLGDVQWILANASAAVPPALAVGALGVETAHERAASLPDTALPAQGIRLEGVSFSYPDRPVLRDLDLEIPAGSSLAVVGVNGAGKSTIINLLSRLYEPDTGRITVDGTDLRDLDAPAWRRRLAIVFQDFLRYELPLRDNVGFGRVDAGRSDQELARVAGIAGLDDVVPTLASGWDTPLSRRFEGGTDLSGGQWQRVALARALLAVEHGARVLVLDEPTANLDVRAEAALYERFLDLTRGLTTILVSHRFATVRLADRICVIDGGRVAEQGSHEELMALGGRYAHMFTLQSAPFRETHHV